MFAPQHSLSQHPVDVGLRSEAAVIAELTRRGYHVLLPFGFNNRYDFVVDLEGKFLRVQVKTGRWADGAIRFSTRSVRASMTGVFTRSYQGEIDVFAVYCPHNEGIYVIPVEQASRAEMWLRVEPPANGQAKGIRWARDYELPG